MITQEQYELARELKKENQNIIDQYFKEKADEFKRRIERFDAGEEFFKEDELRYSATTLCKCGYGLAYPKGCGGHHHWDCSGVLTGKVSLKDNDTCNIYPFSSYSIKSEDQIDPRCEINEKGDNKTFQEMGVTSRGVFKPKVEKCS